MAQTPNSTGTAYCSGAQAVVHVDARWWAIHLTDDGAPVALADVPAHPTLAALLLAASGEVERACARGKRYSPADLAALAGTAGGEDLAALVADLAAWRALRRRRPDAPATDGHQAARAVLEALALGEEVWPLLETGAAGLMGTAPNRSDDPQGTTVGQARRYFGVRGRDRRRG